MKIALASDHAGYHLKLAIRSSILNKGYDIIDLGTDSEEPVDYPDLARKIALSITNNEAERGILICGSGVGASVAANKFRGIRAGLCHDTYSAHQGVEHDDMNVLCLGSRVIGIELALEICLAFLKATFSGETRHVRRLTKITEIENEGPLS